MIIKTIRLNRDHAFEGSMLVDLRSTKAVAEEMPHGLQISRDGVPTELIPWSCVDRVFYDKEPAPVVEEQPQTKGARAK